MSLSTLEATYSWHFGQLWTSCLAHFPFFLLFVHSHLFFFPLNELMNKADPVSAPTELLVQLKTLGTETACRAIVGKGCAGESTQGTYFREGRDSESLLRKKKVTKEQKRIRDG